MPGYRPGPTTLCVPSHYSWILAGLFLISGDQGGFEQKKSRKVLFPLLGVCGPQQSEVLHDAYDGITEYLTTQARVSSNMK